MLSEIDVQHADDGYSMGVKILAIRLLTLCFNVFAG